MRMGLKKQITDGKVKEKVQETEMQRQRHLHTQKSYKNTNPETIIYMQRTCKVKIKKKQKVPCGNKNLLKK